MKAFITGISGFVGAGLARYLLKNGIEVHGLIRESSNLWRLNDIKSELHLHIGDLLDEASLKEVLFSVKPNILFHLGVYGAYSSQKDVDRILSTSLLSTYYLLNAAKEAGVGVVVNTGSSSEYGTKDHPMREDELIEPNSYYAVGKAAQTFLCQQFARQENLPIITLRLFSVYGPFEEPGRLVPAVILNSLAGKDVSIADPNIARDFVYIDDVARAYLIAAKKPELSGEVFNIGGGVQHTLKELSDIVISESKSTSRVVNGEYEKRAFDTYTWVADMHKTHSLLGFIPLQDLRSGLVENIRWFKQYAEYYK